MAEMSQGAAGALCAHVSIRIIDGDTIAIGTEHIRLLDIDAPEISRPRCDAEKAPAEAARAALGEMLAGQRLAIPWQPGPAAWAARATHWCGGAR